MSEQLPLSFCRSRARGVPIVARTRTRPPVAPRLAKDRPLRGWPDNPEWCFKIQEPSGRLVAHFVYAVDEAEARELIAVYMPGKLLAVQRSRPMSARYTFTDGLTNS